MDVLPLALSTRGSFNHSPGYDCPTAARST